MTGYDAFITKVPKGTSPVITKVPKPYPEEPNILYTEAGIGILNEDGSGLLMEVG